jgi:hypothetical protein
MEFLFSADAKGGALTEDSELTEETGDAEDRVEKQLEHPRRSVEAVSRATMGTVDIDELEARFQELSSKFSLTSEEAGLLKMIKKLELVEKDLDDSVSALTQLADSLPSEEGRREDRLLLGALVVSSWAITAVVLIRLLHG